VIEVSPFLQGLFAARRAYSLETRQVALGDLDELMRHPQATDSFRASARLASTKLRDDIRAELVARGYPTVDQIGTRIIQATQTGVMPTVEELFTWRAALRAATSYEVDREVLETIMRLVPLVEQAINARQTQG